MPIKFIYLYYRQPVIEKKILDISQHLEAAQKVNMDESDSNDSDSKLSDMEITTKTTTKTYDDEINEGGASRRTIRDFQQVSSRNRDGHQMKNVSFSMLSVMT
ncbi:uncharacterized protein LOC143898555 [Temnothorax americanus]|uniref:uncharacterized protein LOC143898555 n=1 Tax=Temnothorax americanus TaxID=1964332 RepID=UPI0040687A10